MSRDIFRDGEKGEKKCKRRKKMFLVNNILLERARNVNFLADHAHH